MKGYRKKISNFCKGKKKNQNNNLKEKKIKLKMFNKLMQTLEKETKMQPTSKNKNIKKYVKKWLVDNKNKEDQQVNLNKIKEIFRKKNP